MAFFEVKQGDSETIIKLVQGRNSVGRSSNCQVRIDGDGVEDVHFTIEKIEDGRFKLVDSGTKIGTTINGNTANVFYLEGGEEIVIGDVHLSFQLEPFDVMKRHPGGIRLRKKSVTARRRVVFQKGAAEKVDFTIEDVRVVMQAFATRFGESALKNLTEELDSLYEIHTGRAYIQRLTEDRENLLKLIDVIKFLNSRHDVKSLVNFVIDTVIELTAAERGFLVLKEKDGGKEQLVVKCARNFDKEEIKSPEGRISHTISLEVIRTGKAILSQNAMEDPTLPASRSVQELKLRSVCCVPFLLRGEVIGCFYIDNRFESGVFTNDDLAILQAFADQVAIAIDNAKLYEELVKSQKELETLNAILKDRVETQYKEIVKVTQDYVIYPEVTKFKYDYSNIIGRAKAMLAVFAILDRVVDADEPVLILGESGTGKELIARAVHFNGKRKSFPFVPVNCAAIPSNLLESELFGYMKGSFTGADKDRVGLFETANRGTIFLDEIGDMPLEMQAKLLRVLESGEVRRVGGAQPVRVEVRIIAATNKDLKEMVKQAKYREDLYYRLNVVPMKLPPLRDRKEDVPVLVDHFLKKVATRSNKPVKKVDELALWYLQNYDWPGNIRELENEITRLSVIAGDLIGPELLKEEIMGQKMFKPSIPTSRMIQAAGLKEIVKSAISEVEKQVILGVLRETGWVKARAAEILGISRPTLDAKIEEYQLEKYFPK